MMKITVVNSKKKLLVDDEDYTRVNFYNWRLTKNGDSKIITAWMYDKTLTIGRFIMGVADSKLCVDHINHDAFDNRRENLRVITRSQNNANSKKRKGQFSSEFKGVCWENYTKSWLAQIQVYGKMKNLGRFPVAIDAARAYDSAAKGFFGEAAELNFK